MSVWRNKQGGLSGFSPAAGISVLRPSRVLSAVDRAAGDGGGMGCAGCGGACGGGMGCVDHGVQQEIGWRNAWLRGNDTQGRDVSYAAVDLAGLGDFAPASFPVPHNPLVQNALARSLAGLNGFDTGSVDEFVKSVKDGQTWGVSNLVLVGGAAALLLFLGGGAAGVGRRR